MLWPSAKPQGVVCRRSSHARNLIRRDRTSQLSQLVLTGGRVAAAADGSSIHSLIFASLNSFNTKVAWPHLQYSALVHYQFETVARSSSLRHCSHDFTTHYSVDTRLRTNQPPLTTHHSTLIKLMVVTRCRLRHRCRSTVLTAHPKAEKKQS